MTNSAPVSSAENFMRNNASGGNAPMGVMASGEPNQHER